MASLNLSINGPSIKSSYAAVVNSPPPTSTSATYANWALFSVQAPLMNAFQDGGAKESVLKVESTGDGELADLIEDFSEGRIQFAFVKVKDPNTGLPKSILIAWCGGGVPERTKGYFTSHVAAVAKVLHGYHVQITARSDSDLEPAAIMQKVADASGAKYSSGSNEAAVPRAPPPLKSKPVFTPTNSSSGRAFDPLIAARNKRDVNTDEDGWGQDAPPVTRTQIEKVDSAYKPTKVNMAQLSQSATSQAPQTIVQPRNDGPSDVVKGGYQPIGKVDIAALRAQAKNQADDRPTTVKGAYEPVGKVDIAAIRAKAQKPSRPDPEEPAESQPLADRAAAFSKPVESERLTSLPKPKVGNKFGGGPNFAGTKAPVPNAYGLTGAPSPAPAPVGSASRTFADEGGKTPAQVWAEKKARERGASGSTPQPAVAPSTTSTQGSGAEWKSGYSGKSWAPVQSSAYGRLATGEAAHQDEEITGRETSAEQTDNSTTVSALKDRFKNAAPMASTPFPGASRPDEDESTSEPPPPPVPAGSRPSGGFALPGLPSRPPPVDDEEAAEDENPSAYESHERDHSPPRVAIPVSRGAAPALGTPDEHKAPPPVPLDSIPVPREEELPDEEAADHIARGAAGAVAEQTFEPEEVAAGQHVAGRHSAISQYDYEKGEDNEIDLVEGETITNIDMVDEDWWMGTNSKGESGLFPSVYVELVVDDQNQPAAHAEPAEAATPPAPLPAREPAQPVAHTAAAGHTAVAQYDYEAAEDNELSFPEDAKITNIEFPDEDWWFGHYNGNSGLFPADYVTLDA